MRSRAKFIQKIASHFSYFILGAVFVMSCGSESTQQAIGSAAATMMNAIDVVFDPEDSGLPGNVQEALTSLADKLKSPPPCPPEMVQVGSSCVDIQRNREHLNPEHGLNNATTMKTATQTCRDKGKRLCKIDELLNACYDNSIQDMGLAEEGVPHEWTSDYTLVNGGTLLQRPYSMFGNTNTNQPPTECRSLFTSFAHDELPGDGSSYLNEFRCCIQAVDR